MKPNIKAIAIGQAVFSLLGLKISKAGLINTSFGTKSIEGLGNVVIRIVDEETERLSDLYPTEKMERSIQLLIANKLGSDYSLDRVTDVYVDLLRLNDYNNIIQSEMALNEAIDAII